jgi:hypothetical protein
VGTGVTHACTDCVAALYELENNVRTNVTGLHEKAYVKRRRILTTLCFVKKDEVETYAAGNSNRSVTWGNRCHLELSKNFLRLFYVFWAA